MDKSKYSYVGPTIDRKKIHDRQIFQPEMWLNLEQSSFVQIADFKIVQIADFKNETVSLFQLQTFQAIR